MAFNRSNFLLSLAVALAEACDPPMTPGSDLFAQAASEVTAADPFTLLSIYGGAAPDEFRRVPVLSIQAYTTSADPSAGMEHCCRLFDSLYDDDGGNFVPPRPRNSWTIPGMVISGGAVVADGDTEYFVVVIVPRGEPGKVGHDSANAKFFHAVNFDVRVDA